MVSSLDISQIKRKCGLDVGQNHNLSKKEDAKVPQCPPEKESAIAEALRSFRIIWVHRQYASTLKGGIDKLQPAVIIYAQPPNLKAYKHPGPEMNLRAGIIDLLSSLTVI